MDLNKACFDKILNSVKGKSVLEVGCGKCILSNEIQKKEFKVTALDMHIGKGIKDKFPHLNFVVGDAESLPFKDKQFDTVICAHTIEHVRDLFTVINELRRVCSKRLIIVVPKQREYRYTFDLHIHFFPNKDSFILLMQNKKSICKIIEGYIFYIEDFD